MLKKLLLFSLLIVYFNVFALNVNIKSNKYNIYEKSKIILSNFDLSSLDFDGSEISLSLDDQVYEFSKSTKNLETGKEYVILLKDSDVSYSLYFTTLPIISLNTSGSIGDEDIYTEFVLNEVGKEPVKFHAGIALRGSTSRTFPKKQYKLEFWKDTSGEESEDVSIMGMREDSEYNFWAMYNEPLRARNMTSWQLWDKIGRLYYQEEEPEAKPGVEMQYAELFLNGNFKGIYAIGEKIDRKQLKLKKFKNGEIKGELYKAVDYNMTNFDTVYQDFDNTNRTWYGWEMKYPKESETTDWQNFYGLLNFTAKSDNNTFLLNIQNYFDQSSLIDYFIFVNTVKANDNTAKNIYVARYSKNKPYFFVPWDLDQVFGRKWSPDALLIRDENANGIRWNYVLQRLWNLSPEYKEAAIARWRELRDSNTISYYSVMQLYKDNYNYLKNNGVYNRERKLYNVVIAQDENEEFSFIKTWLKARITFLDTFFGYENLSVVDLDSSKITVYPNPSSDVIHFKGTPKVSEIWIYSMNGSLVVSQQVKDQEINISALPKGMYILKMKNSQGQLSSIKIFKH